jgi:hypothetical protein
MVVIEKTLIMLQLNVVIFILLSVVLFLDFTRGESNKARVEEGEIFAADGSTQKYEKGSQKIRLLHGYRRH